MNIRKSWIGMDRKIEKNKNNEEEFTTEIYGILDGDIEKLSKEIATVLKGIPWVMFRNGVGNFSLIISAKKEAVASIENDILNYLYGNRVLTDYEETMINDSHAPLVP